MEFSVLLQVASLEAEREGLISRSREAVQSERAAVAGCAKAEARAKSVERSSEIRVREVEAEAARLRQQLEKGADATEVGRVITTYIRMI